jgi:hypothetical protein
VDVTLATTSAQPIRLKRVILTIPMKSTARSLIALPRTPRTLRKDQPPPLTDLHVEIVTAAAVHGMPETSAKIQPPAVNLLIKKALISMHHHPMHLKTHQQELTTQTLPNVSREPKLESNQPDRMITGRARSLRQTKTNPINWIPVNTGIQINKS